MCCRNTIKLFVSKNGGKCKGLSVLLVGVWVVFAVELIRVNLAIGIGCINVARVE